MPTVVAAPRASSAAALLRQAQRTASAEGRPLLVPYLTDAVAQVLPADLAGARLLQAFDCWHESEAGSPEEYVATLPRKRRQALNRRVRDFVRAGLTAGVEPLREHIDVFARLVTNTSAKYGLASRPQAMAEHLRHIAAVYGDDAVLFVATDDRGEIVGAVLGLLHADELYLRMTGFDYAATDGSSTYLVLAYHQPLAYRRERPHRRVHHGTGLLYTKLLHGARPRPLWTLLLGARTEGVDFAGINGLRAAELLEGLPAEMVDLAGGTLPV
ncbi:GNAT family N-acetyltransferase [Micromonospora sp. NPDC048830]|uniref:GNAT family N-acetyltransferase n=1 Tax=Micromonospora sp. NPDC048830 TaxID=3364257 RepID=UPI00371147C4